METRRGWMVWWSGVFGAASFVHLIRAMLGVPVSVGAASIPLWVSWVVAPAAGAASAWLLSRAAEASPVLRRKPSAHGRGPCAGTTEHRPESGPGYCGIQVGGDGWGDAWLDE